MPYKKAKSGMKGMTVIYSGDSNVVVKKNGTLAWRNNNPGNIIFSPFAKSQGAIGENKGFAVFPNTETGRNAQTALLKTKDFQGRTIAKAIEKYAPPESNPTESYIKYVTKQTGMSRDKKLSDMTPQDFDNFSKAIRRYELLTPGTEVTLPHPDKIKYLLHSPRGSSQESSSDRSLKRVGDTVYRIDKGRIIGSFTCNGRKK
ncbi:MAG: hypothetical protein HY893_08230 [Deltaproteobacteria bacterium]|nr:hypothetical protein [Deltaproteobacteria bacterium]